MTPKSDFILSTLRNRFQQLLLLMFHPSLKIFIKFLFLRPWCTSTPFYAKRARYSVHLSDSSMRDNLIRSNFFTDEIKKVVSTCLRSETGSNSYNFWSFTMHSISSSNFFRGPAALPLRFTLREHVILFISVISPWGIFLKEAFSFTDDTKNWFYPVYA